ncbi:phosphonopyruvate decarboxylase [Actinoplanes subtropicus]|uniref:phosphonopyruvate decarboxylase n=1 Tax=Actinoplanes subtropicus TaxID=543632 RepID=UPI00068D9C3C|nr:phosphonopyruvate decarboxylase [Actinoplanes subtropicus]
MIDGAAFVAALRSRGFRFFAGVPCSYLGSVIDELGGEYVAAANEGAALGMAAGAQVTGGRSAVLLQNSGVGNLVNPLTSLVVPYRIPVLLVVSMRGWPDPADDEVQHSVMGPATPAILTACQVAHRVLDPDPALLRDALDELDQVLRSGSPAALLVGRRTMAKSAGAPGGGPGWTRRDAIRAVVRHVDQDLVFATTGYIARELFAVGDRPGNFYMQGAMGHALAMGVGAARTTGERVWVLDGDGAAVMHLGTMVTTGSAGLPNLVHVVLNNAAYESTGGQPTCAGRLDWARLGEAAGYRTSHWCRTPETVESALRRVAAEPGPHLVVIDIAIGPAQAPPRATRSLEAPAISARLRETVNARLAAAPGRGAL